MKQSVRLGRVAGIPVGANWSVAVIMVIIVDLIGGSVLPAAVPHQRAVAYWGLAFVAAVAFLASLLAHELAHAVVARRNGIRVRSITLFMLGGITQLDGEPAGPGADLRIALAGPVTSVLAGAVFLGVAAAVSAASGPRVAVATAAWLALMNGVLAVFNLLPGAPLDGGRVLRALLWRLWGDRRRAEHGAARAGWVIGAAIAGFGVIELLLYGLLVEGLWLVLIGWFMAVAATAEDSASQAATVLAGVRVADVMSPDPDLAPGWVTVADFIDRIAGPPTQTAFPVVGLDGKMTGLVTLRQLARMAPGQRAEVRVGQVATPVPPEYLAAPDDPVAPLLARRPLGGELAAIVQVDNRILGLVTTAGLQRALRWRKLAGART